VLFLTYNEYQQYVEYATENYIKIPHGLISDYFNWEHRATLARCLIRAGKLAPAIELYKSIILLEVDNTIRDNSVYSALENKVWCMEELGQALWRYEKDAAAALLYINMAIDLAQSYPWKFEFVVRGEIWRNKWEILQASGQGDVAWAEAVKKSHNTELEVGKSNSMLFHAFSFLAEQAKKVDDLPLATSLLRKALRFFPKEYEDIKQLNAIWENRYHHPEDTYQQLYDLTQHDALVWGDAGKDVPIQ